MNKKKKELKEITLKEYEHEVITKVRESLKQGQKIKKVV